MKKILLLINPKARNGQEAYESMQDKLISHGHAIIELSATERENDPNSLIRKYQPEISYVVIGGGDGSVNFSLPALIETNLPLVVYPLGTANNLARSLELAMDIDQIINLLETGVVKKIDLGVVNDIPFVNVAGLGLSTKVNINVSSEHKKRFGVLAFIWTAFKFMPYIRPFRAHILRSDGSEFISRSWQISVCNGKYYGAGMAIKDDASLLDENLHCLSTEIKNWWQVLSLAPAFFSGRYKHNHEVSLLQDKSFEIKTRKRYPIDVDGDVKTYTPAIFKILPKALSILVPKDVSL
jgi:diacylglycerol kinase (ATP)